MASTDTSLIVALFAFGLLSVLTLLVFAKRILRGHAERSSAHRRAGWVAALGSGRVVDMRPDELRRLARQAARRAAPQEDLLALLESGALPPRGAHREPFESALRRAGLVAALPAACRSRHAVARGRAALIWARLGLPGAELGIAPLIADPDPDVRSAATQAIACCASEAAAWTLLDALRDGHIAPERVVERLTGNWAAVPVLQAFHEPSFAPVRAWLAEALGLIRDPRAEISLSDMLLRGEEEERIRACRALGRLGRPTSVVAFMTALEDPSASVRAQAARGLAGLRDPRTVKALVRLLDDTAWWVRARAADALRTLGPTGLAALARAADEHPDLFARERAIEALGLHPGGALAPVGAHAPVAA